MSGGSGRGTLLVRGSIDVSQLWPSGNADADTLRIEVDEQGRAAFFQRRPGAAARRLPSLEDVVVRGRIITPAMRKGSVVVRLQGVDAPELHYQPAFPLPLARLSKAAAARLRRWRLTYRQPMAETAVAGIRTLLSSGPRVSCLVRSEVDDPLDVFDTYGRVVGDVVVRIAGRETCLNHWLLERGLGLPSLYASMSLGEVDRAVTAGRKGRRRGVWRRLTRVIPAAGWIRRLPRFNRHTLPGVTRALVHPPKLFRLLATWALGREGGLAGAGFGDWLSARDERYFVHRAWLDGARSTRPLAELVVDGRWHADPFEVVHEDAPAAASFENH